jgi:hypothetical protein
MRRLIWLGLVLALSWSGWWLIAASSMRGGIEQWFADRRAEGWQAETVDTRLSGYPLSIDILLDRPALADPDTGVAFETSSMRLSAPTWWPGHITVTLPEQAMRVATTRTRHDVSAEAATAVMRLRPRSDLQLQEMAVSTARWSITSPEGALWSADALTLTVRQDETTPELYAFVADAPNFVPGGVPRRQLRIPQDWPIAFASLKLEALIRFDRPFDRRTIEDSRPQPRRIDLSLAEAAWGPLLLRSAAALDVSEEGKLTGEWSLQARNWQDILTLAENAGTLPSQLRPQLDNILAALARGGGNPDAIDVTLTLRNGQIFLGFIPLGQAPRVILR